MVCNARSKWVRWVDGLQNEIEINETQFDAICVFDLMPLHYVTMGLNKFFDVDSSPVAAVAAQFGTET